MSHKQLAVRVSELSKQYVIHHQQEPEHPAGANALGLRARLADSLASLRPKTSSEVFWALTDVSFDVYRGDVIGIIGRNGAGKSTLLKILSRITEPTRGEISLYGRVGSLLEVGTGFHPELTGRENIFLNGAILGMRRSEIQAKFDEIVEFSGVEKFLDTPVKRFSSGMYVRLAFAVAAHLDPDILVVDEVLAVGDQNFQKKCLGKMQEVAGAGRTVMLVSHNMTTVTRLCSRCVMLTAGTVAAIDRADIVAALYLSGKDNDLPVVEWEPEKAPGDDVVRLNRVAVTDEFGESHMTYDITRPVHITAEYTVSTGGHVLVPNYHVYNAEGVHLFTTGDNDAVWRYSAKEPGIYRTTVVIPGNYLAEGRTIITPAMSTVNPFILRYEIPELLAFQVIDSLDSRGVRQDYAGSYPGVVRPWLNWNTQVLMPQ